MADMLARWLQPISFGCSLYINVITAVKGFGDFLWVDVVEKIDSMGSQVNEFQNLSKKLPKVSSHGGVITLFCPTMHVLYTDWCSCVAGSLCC